jgi:hypothetical protein
MGGVLCVAIRRTNGDVYVGERNTNPLPAWLSDPAFFSDGKLVDKYIAAGNDESGMNAIQPVSYGIVLVDFKTKSILSRQNYTQIGGFFLCIPGDVYGEKIVQKLFKRKWVRQIKAVDHPTCRNFTYMDAEGMAHLERYVNKHDSFPHSLVVVEWCPPKWQIDDTSPSSVYDWKQEQWQEICDWLDVRGWNTTRLPPEQE